MSSEWDEFSEAIKTPKTNPNADQVTNFQTPEHSQKLVETITPLQQVPETHDREIIPDYPTENIVLQVEEIPSLDIFYSPSHKAVVKRRNMRRIDETVSDLRNESVDILWKDPLADPTKNLTKLS